jgi:hypothetical protein
MAKMDGETKRARKQRLLTTDDSAPRSTLAAWKRTRAKTPLARGIRVARCAGYSHGQQSDCPSKLMAAGLHAAGGSW